VLREMRARAGPGAGAGPAGGGAAPGGGDPGEALMGRALRALESYARGGRAKAGALEATLDDLVRNTRDASAGNARSHAVVCRFLGRPGAADALFRVVRSNLDAGEGEDARRARGRCHQALTALGNLAGRGPEDAAAVFAARHSVLATTEAVQIFRRHSSLLSAALALLARLVAPPALAAEVRRSLRGGDGMGNLRTVSAVLAAKARTQRLDLRLRLASAARARAQGLEAAAALERQAAAAEREAAEVEAQARAVGAAVETLDMGGAGAAFGREASPMATPGVERAVRHLAELANQSPLARAPLGRRDGNRGPERGSIYPQGTRVPFWEREGDA